MPFITMNSYLFDRRSFMRITGSVGVSGLFAGQGFDALVAAPLCVDKAVNTKLDTAAPGKTLHYWVDGLHFGENSNIVSRANLSMFLDLPQTPASYVESVLFADDDNNLIDARFFTPGDRMTTGHAPYVVFENIELNHEGNYRIYYQIHEGSNTRLFLSRIANPTRSVLNNAYLPAKMREDFNKHVGNTAGLLTSPFQYYTWNGLEAHCARGRIKDIAADGQFKIDIDFMHNDVGEAHYMRYFMVCDPVGRILGYRKRNYEVVPSGDNVPNGSSNGSNYMSVGRMSETQRKDLDLTVDQIPNINDCPYIQIYTEDYYDALARTTIRLR